MILLKILRWTVAPTLINSLGSHTFQRDLLDVFLVKGSRVSPRQFSSFVAWLQGLETEWDDGNMAMALYVFVGKPVINLQKSEIIPTTK